MNTNLLLMKLAKKNKGSYFKMSWCSDVSMSADAKKQGLQAVKIVESTVRYGLRYSNIKSVKERRLMKAFENGGIKDEGEGQLKWGQWKAKYEGILVEHKEKDYFRFYTSPNKPNVKFILNGVEITKQELMDLKIGEKPVVINSYWNSNVEGTMTVKVENIIDIY
jgi:hypothetical protein